MTVNSAPELRLSLSMKEPLSLKHRAIKRPMQKATVDHAKQKLKLSKIILPPQERKLVPKAVKSPKAVRSPLMGAPKRYSRKYSGA